jgi:hypothetical protein
MLDQRVYQLLGRIRALDAAPKEAVELLFFGGNVDAVSVLRGVVILGHNGAQRVVAGVDAINHGSDVVLDLTPQMRLFALCAATVAVRSAGIAVARRHGGRCGACPQGVHKWFQV